MRTDAPVIRLVPATITSSSSANDNLPDGMMNSSQSIQPEVAQLAQAESQLDRGYISPPSSMQPQSTIIGAGNAARKGGTKKKAKSPSQNKKKGSKQQKKKKKPTPKKSPKKSPAKKKKSQSKSQSKKK